MTGQQGLRALRLADAGLTVDLATRARRLAGYPPAITEAEARAFMSSPTAEPARDGRLLTVDDVPTGFVWGHHTPGASGALLVVAVAEAPDRPDAFRTLVTAGCELLAGQAPSLQRVEIDGIPEPDAEAAGAIESCGFRQSRLACLMSIDLASASAPTPLPAEVVPDVWPEEPAALHAVGQLNHEVFLDHDGEYAWSAEEFVHFVTSVPLVRPELSVLVSHDGQPVGLTLAIDEPTDPTGGTIYIASVAVSRAWRGQGIARHLLLETFRRAAAAGMRRATLNVQLGNRTGADRLYESVGMVSSDRELGFTRDLGNPR